MEKEIKDLLKKRHASKHDNGSTTCTECLKNLGYAQAIDDVLAIIRKYYD